EALAGLRERDNAVEAVVYREVPKPPPAAIPESFRAWCEERGVCALPARPAAVSLFIMQHRDEGLGLLEQLGGQIGAAHIGAGLADPSASYPVPQTMNKIAAINPPRSWSKEEWPKFRSLPYSLQTYVCKREADRDRELKRCQSDANLWRKSRETKDEAK